MVRGPGLRLRPDRRPRHGFVGRGRPRRVHGDRDARRLRRGRVGRGAGLVQRRHRDVGHQLRGVHLDPGRQAPAAAPPGHRPGPGHRRPLRDRRPLHRRLRDRERAIAVRRQPGGDERDAPRHRAPRRGLARRVAGAPGGDAAVAHHLAAEPDGRFVLATWLAGPGLRRHRGRDLQHRWLVRRLRRLGVPHAGAVHGAVADARRQLGPRLAAGLQPGPQPRRAARGRPVLRSLAEGRAQRPRRRAGRRLVRARLLRSGAVPRGVARSMAGGFRVPPPRGRGRVSGGSTAACSRLPGGLSDADARTTEGVNSFDHQATRGTRSALSWGAGGIPNGLARDLRPDDALGPTYTSDPLDEPLSILGEPDGGSPSRGLGAGRDRGRASLGRRPRRHCRPR